MADFISHDGGCLRTPARCDTERAPDLGSPSGSYYIVGGLTRRGQRAVAVTLRSGPGQGLGRYRELIVEAGRGFGGPVAIVAQSPGGFERAADVRHPHRGAPGSGERHDPDGRRDGGSVVHQCRLAGGGPGGRGRRRPARARCQRRRGPFSTTCHRRSSTPCGRNRGRALGGRRSLRNRDRCRAGRTWRRRCLAGREDRFPVPLQQRVPRARLGLDAHVLPEATCWL